MKRYIFFLRHYNDIDNIAPAIYFFLKQDADNFATVILYDEKYDYKNDENLELLRNSFPRQYEQKWLGDLFGIPHSAANRRYKSKSTIKKVLSFVEKKLFINLKKVIKKSRIIEKVYRNKHDMHKIRTGNVEIQYICDNIKNTIKCPENPSLVVFDVVRYGMVSGLVDALHMMGIYNLVCLPVSPLINYNVLREDWMVDVYSDKFLREHDYSAFTALGYVDEYFYNSYEKLFDNLGLESTLKDKVVSLGSIRFSSEWLRIRDASYGPTFNKPAADRGTRILFLLSRYQSNVNASEIQKTIDLLCCMDSVKIIVKGHTREYQNKTGINDSNIVYDAKRKTADLIEWADVILFWSTSVAIEGFIKNKTMVCLNYITANKNLYQLYNTGYIANCRDDLLNFVIAYMSNTHQKYYNIDGIEKFMCDVVYAGNTKRPVYINYLEFMSENEITV